MVWHTPLAPIFGKQRQVHVCDFEGSMVYIMSSRSVGRHSDIVSKKTKQSHELWQVLGALAARETEAEDHLGFGVQVSIAHGQIQSQK